MQGKTVLYVPNEGLDISAEEASRNKEYVQRLESELHAIQFNAQILFPFL